jgi:Outer membrane protein beta-barrel domain
MRIDRPINLALTLLALVALMAPSLSAQRNRRTAKTPQRSGLWFSGGLGYGSFGCDNCDKRQGGVSGGLSIGGTLSPRLLLGAGTTGWTKSEDGTTLTIATLDARARFYPAARGRFFVTGGLGLGSLKSKISGIGSNSQTGTSALIGVGMDLRMSRNASVTPYSSLYLVRTNRAKVNVMQLGAAITMH